MESKQTDYYGFIKIDVTEPQLTRAEERFEFGALKGSITKGDGNLAGALGEIIVLDYMLSKGNEVKDISTYDYDLIIDGYRVDVKSKRQKYAPQPNHRCTVSAYNTRQKCDYYFFTQVMYDMNAVYLSGYKKKSDFFNQSTFFEKGDTDPSGQKSDFVFTYDCYVMNLEDLTKFK